MNRNLPGFTAEDSLDRAEGSYRSEAAYLASASIVVPARCGQDSWGPCINGWQWECIEGGYPRRVRCDW
jgi:hypothetical protein